MKAGPRVVDVAALLNGGAPQPGVRIEDIANLVNGGRPQSGVRLEILAELVNGGSPQPGVRLENLAKLVNEGRPQPHVHRVDLGERKGHGMPDLLSEPTTGSTPCCEDCAKPGATPCGAKSMAPRSVKLASPIQWPAGRRADRRMPDRTFAGPGRLWPFGRHTNELRCGVLHSLTPAQQQCVSDALDAVRPIDELWPGDTGSSGDYLAYSYRHWPENFADKIATSCGALWPTGVAPDGTPYDAFDIGLAMADASAILVDVTVSDVPGFPPQMHYGQVRIDSWFNPGCEYRPSLVQSRGFRPQPTPPQTTGGLSPAVLQSERCRVRHICQHDLDMAEQARNNTNLDPDVPDFVEYDPLNVTDLQLSMINARNAAFASVFFGWMGALCSLCMCDGIPIGPADITCLMLSTSFFGIQLGERPPNLSGLACRTRWVCEHV